MCPSLLLLTPSVMYGVHNALPRRTPLVLLSFYRYAITAMYDNNAHAIVTLCARVTVMLLLLHVSSSLSFLLSTPLPLATERSNNCVHSSSKNNIGGTEVDDGARAAAYCRILQYYNKYSSGRRYNSTTSSHSSGEVEKSGKGVRGQVVQTEQRQQQRVVQLMARQSTRHACQQRGGGEQQGGE